jgi:hypothetical protein
MLITTPKPPLGVVRTYHSQQRQTSSWLFDYKWKRNLGCRGHLLPQETYFMMKNSHADYRAKRTRRAARPVGAEEDKKSEACLERIWVLIAATTSLSSHRQRTSRAIFE